MFSEALIKVQLKHLLSRKTSKKYRFVQKQMIMNPLLKISKVSDFSNMAPGNTLSLTFLAVVNG